VHFSFIIRLEIILHQAGNNTEKSERHTIGPQRAEIPVELSAGMEYRAFSAMDDCHDNGHRDRKTT